jgi:hypothetical protein
LDTLDPGDRFATIPITRSRTCFRVNTGIGATRWLSRYARGRQVYVAMPMARRTPGWRRIKASESRARRRLTAPTLSELPDPDAVLASGDERG